MGTGIGERILRVMRFRGISQTQLAQMLNISQTTVSAWGKLGKAPSTKRLPDIAKVLGVTVDFLLGEDGGDDDLREMRDIPAPDGSDTAPIIKDLVDIIKSQQNTIDTLSRTIENHGKKK
jgi:transcriptional regulator with XRE-family HTH domain